MSLTAHFIDSSFVYHRFSFNVKHSPGSHTGHMIADNVTKMIYYCLSLLTLLTLHLCITDSPSM
jgi:hypothetical protein